jgi:dephospho-CoA kinase
MGAMYLPVDQLAHALYVPGTAVHRRLVREFGPSILGNGGVVDRRKLSVRVFANRRAMERLERAVHPALGAAARAALARMRERWPVTVVEAGPILFTLGLDKACAVVVLVTCPRSVQVARLARSRGISRADASRRLAAVAVHQSAAVRSARSRKPGRTVVVDTTAGIAAMRTVAERLMGAVACG